MAERIKIVPFMIFTVLYVGLIYPIAGSWKWGGGFLDQMGFYDFAGSTLVHSVGGWAALVAVYLLGSRIGKFKDGKIQAIPGHNIPLATAGVLISMVRNLGIRKILLLIPTRSDQYKAGPLEVSFIKAAITKIGSNKTRKKQRETNKSKTRFINAVKSNKL